MEMETGNDVGLASERPDVGRLLRIYEECTPIENGWDRLRESDRVRFTVWEGQSSDGRKWDANLPDGKPAFPWDGASDQRVNLADGVVNDLVDILCNTFWRAQAQVHGVEVADLTKAGLAQKVLEWVRGTKLARELVNEVELDAQYALSYGVSVKLVTWAREIGYRNKRVSLQELLAYAVEVMTNDQGGNVQGRSQGPNGQMEELEQAMQLAGMIQDVVLDPAKEPEAVEFIQKLYGRYVEESVSAKVLSYAAAESSWGRGGLELKPKQARRVVRELRARGEARVPLPYVCKNRPVVRVLKPNEEVFFPKDTPIDLQEARVIFAKEYMSEAALRARGAADGWHEEFIERAAESKGQRTVWSESQSSNALTELGLETAPVNDELVEIVYAYAKQVDEEGVTGIYYTVLCPAAGGNDQSTNDKEAEEEDYGKHELLDYAHGKYPFVLMQREVLSRKAGSSRGVPEIVSTWQRGSKVQLDSLTDRTSFSTLPPIVVPQLDGVGHRYNPGAEVPVPRKDLAPEFMQTPGGRGDIEALKLLEFYERITDLYFGRRRADTPPEQGAQKNQRLVTRWLLSWSEVYAQILALMQQYMEEEELARVLGENGAGLSELSEEEIERQFDMVLTFDVEKLNPEFVDRKLKAITEMVAPLDRAGVLNFPALTRAMVRAVDPTLEKELILEQTAASEQMTRKVKSDFLGMAMGLPSELVENDPTAGEQLRIGQQILQLPKFLERYQGDEEFRALVDEWLKNREHSVNQRENAVRGRLGVAR